MIKIIVTQVIFLFQVKKGLENQKLAMKDDEIREINQQMVLRSAKIEKEKVLDRAKDLKSSYILLDLHDRIILDQNKLKGEGQDGY